MHKGLLSEHCFEGAFGVRSRSQIEERWIKNGNDPEKTRKNFGSFGELTQKIHGNKPGREEARVGNKMGRPRQQSGKLTEFL